MHPCEVHPFLHEWIKIADVDDGHRKVSLRNINIGLPVATWPFMPHAYMIWVWPVVFPSCQLDCFFCSQLHVLPTYHWCHLLITEYQKPHQLLLFFFSFCSFLSTELQIMPAWANAFFYPPQAGFVANHFVATYFFVALRPNQRRQKEELGGVTWSAGFPPARGRTLPRRVSGWETVYCSWRCGGAWGTKPRAPGPSV